MKKRISRRRLLRGAAGVAIGLPLLDAMIPVGQSCPTSSAKAQDGVPKRFAAFHHGSGMGNAMNLWRCSGTEDDWSLGSLLSPFERHKDELLVFDGIRINKAGGEGHTDAMGSCLTGMPIRAMNGPALGISVDQAIANHIGAATRVKTLDLSPRRNHPNTPWGWMSFSGPEAPVLPEQDPRRAFNALFGGFDPDAVATPSSEVATRIAQRRSVLDYVMDDYSRVALTLGTDDRRKIDAHLQAIREIEMRLDVNVASACSVPDDPNEDLDYPQRVRVMMDLMVAAFACDATRVATFNFEGSADNMIYRWLGTNDRHHKAAHNEEPDSMNTIIKVREYFYGEIAYFLDRMKEVPEVDGTLLDHSAVLFYTEMGEVHAAHPVPFHLAGKAGGSFRTGRLMNVGDTPHNNLLVSLANAFGLEGDSFGNPSWCTGPIDLS